METLFPCEAAQASEVALNNLIVGQRRSGSVTVGNLSMRFAFCQGHSSYEPKTYIKGHISDHTFCLTLDQMLPLNLFIKDLAEADISLFPKSLAPLIRELAFGPLLQAVSKTLGVRVSVENFGAEKIESDFPSDEAVVFAFILHTNQPEFSRIQGQLSISATGAEFLAAILEPIKMYSRAALATVSFPVYFFAGKERLTLAQLQNVRPQDVLLLRQSKESWKANKGWVQLGFGQSYRAIFKNNQCVLEAVSEDVFMSSDDKQTVQEAFEASSKKSQSPKPSGELAAGTKLPEASGSIPQGMEDLPIDVAFEVGRKRISLEELASIQAGYAFELSSSLERPVVIRANGTVIGEGQLLRIGDHVGVRVISIHQQ